MLWRANINRRVIEDRPAAVFFRELPNLLDDPAAQRL
jgi:hypothetical protein